MNTEHTKYNGWTNRETWLVNVWEFAESIEDRNQSAEAIADELRSMVSFYIEESFPAADGFLADILPSADCIMGKINFTELAEAIKEDA
tara:strand:- start:44 stop:310 length:267 start_codon:yes stop_codon:yes gene_type:complete